MEVRVVVDRQRTTPDPKRELVPQSGRNYSSITGLWSWCRTAIHRVSVSEAHMLSIASAGVERARPSRSVRLTTLGTVLGTGLVVGRGCQFVLWSTRCLR
jgi:hypothetical protein